jgi:uncharacterized membrane protein YjgN (DUF898 family)
MRFEPYLGSEPDPAADATVATPRFSGSGAEYFRIWIVNLLLTVASLGIYSAWAKTRRLQYFYRNTHLAGASFDFLGDPKAILRGRIVAVVLVVLYQYAFGFSVKAGAAIICLLLAGLPFMMRSALRFRLANTVYRGLPFGFAGGMGDAYRVYLPALALAFVPGMLLALFPAKGWVFLVFLLFLGWPLLHAAMKAYQHRHLVYGDQGAAFRATLGQLARPYLKMLGWFVLLVIVLLVLVAVPVYLVSQGLGTSKLLIGVLFGIAFSMVFYVAFLLCGVYVTVRMDNLAWSATYFPGVYIVSNMRLRTYLRLQAVNVLLTVLTLGLYRPFAVVRTWKYRLAHVRIDAPDGFEQANLQAARRAVAAVGDGAADFLGVDLSW